MPEDQVRGMISQVAAVAADEGLAYDFDALKVTGTLAAHQLLHYAKGHGRILGGLGVGVCSDGVCEVPETQPDSGQTGTVMVADETGPTRPDPRPTPRRRA